MNQPAIPQAIADELRSATNHTSKMSRLYGHFAKVISIASVSVAIPFSIYHVFAGSPQVAIMLAPVIMLQSYLAYYFLCKGYNQNLAIALVAMQLVCTVSLVGLFGQSTIVWLFVTGVTSYFLLPIRLALIANIVAAASVALLTVLDPVFLVRFLVAFALFNVCLYAFSKQLVARTDELELMLTIDPLTRAGNRTSLELALARIKSQAERHGHSATLMVIDIDNFKRYNMDLGPREADELLRKIAAVIKHRLRPTDSFYRYHGEEFVLIAENTPISQATYLAEDLRKRVEKRIECATVSIGVTDVRPGVDAYDALLRGKEALANAKAIGPNWVCFDTQESDLEMRQSDLWDNPAESEPSVSTENSMATVKEAIGA